MHLAGHKSPKVTERYAGRLTDDELAKMARPAFSVIYGKKAVQSPDEQHPAWEKTAGSRNAETLGFPHGPVAQW